MDDNSTIITATVRWQVQGTARFDPARMREWLAARGWRLIDERSGWYTVWERGFRDVLVPEVADAGDIRRRVQQMVDGLVAVEPLADVLAVLNIK